MDESTELTAIDLNNNIVKMRHVVARARFCVKQKLGRQIKRLKRTSDQIEKDMMKLNRLIEDMKAAKELVSDDVSKFAFVNTRTSAELLSSAALEPNAEQRALYKLTASKPVNEFISAFRRKYLNWPQEVPFILQRLGNQYRKQKDNLESTKALRNKLVAHSKNDSDYIAEQVFKRTKSAKKRTAAKEVSLKTDHPTVDDADASTSCLPDPRELPETNPRSASLKKKKSPTSVSNLIESEIKHAASSVKKPKKKPKAEKVRSREKQASTVAEPKTSVYLPQRIAPEFQVEDKKGQMVIRKLDLVDLSSTINSNINILPANNGDLRVAETKPRKRDSFFLTGDASDNDKSDLLNGLDADVIADEENESVIKRSQRFIDQAVFKSGMGKKMKPQFSKSFSRDAARQRRLQNFHNVPAKSDVYESTNDRPNSKKENSKEKVASVTESSKQQRKNSLNSADTSSTNVRAFPRKAVTAVRKKIPQAVSQPKPKRRHNLDQKLTDNDDAQMHPSWAAKRRQQELLSSQLSYCGKRTKFSDDA